MTWHLVLLRNEMKFVPSKYRNDCGVLSPRFLQIEVGNHKMSDFLNAKTFLSVLPKWRFSEVLVPSFWFRLDSYLRRWPEDLRGIRLPIFG